MMQTHTSLYKSIFKFYDVGKNRQDTVSDFKKKYVCANISLETTVVILSMLMSNK